MWFLLCTFYVSFWFVISFYWEFYCCVKVKTEAGIMKTQKLLMKEKLQIKLSMNHRDSVCDSDRIHQIHLSI